MYYTLNYVIKEAYGTWQIGILLRTLETMVFKWLM